MAIGDENRLRLQRAERGQARFDMVRLDDLLSSDHRARQVWAYVSGLDLSRLYGAIRVYEGSGGRAATDPAILMALWLYGTLESVGSARLLARLCESDAAYRWLCGGVGMNYHTLADFRVQTGEVLDRQLTVSMVALVDAGIVDVSCLAVDGVRVRASAGTSSFRSGTRLGDLHARSEAKVAQLRAELEADPGENSRRHQERALREEQDRQRRIEAARQAAAAIEAEREKEAREQRRRTPRKSKPARGSTTDGQARVMAMADGGYRPAYNLQFKTDPHSGCVVGLEVTNKASDKGQLGAAVAEIERRYGRRPQRVLADGGYGSKEDIAALHEGEVEVFCPLQAKKQKAKKQKAKKQKATQASTTPEPATQTPVAESPVDESPADESPADESPAAKASDTASNKTKSGKEREAPGVLAWQERMSRPEGMEVYGQRFACERPHADARNRGLQRFLVRGFEKVKAVSLWYVTAFNFLQIQRLAPKAA